MQRILVRAQLGAISVSPSRNRGWAAFLQTCCLLCLLAVVPVGAVAHETMAVEELVQQVRHSVVNVTAIQYIKQNRQSRSFRGRSPDDLFRRFFGPNSPFSPPQTPEEDDQDEDDSEYDRGRESRGEGSGFIISSDGYIVTSFHVVDEAEKVLVSLQDRREFVAEIIGLDRATDLALLRVDAEDLPAATLGDSDSLQVGQGVVAIGSPFQLDFSVTVGVISALGRAMNSDAATGRYVPFIQSDAAINPGNSGGPLYNMDGEVIGVNAQIYTRSGGFMGLSFSVPVNVVRNVVQQLRDTGKVARGWLGVSIQDVNRDLAESLALPKPSGALISSIAEDSPAEAAKLEEGDVIVALNGKEVLYSRDLAPQVGVFAPGTDVEFTVYRNGERLLLPVVIGKLPDPEAEAEAAAANEDSTSDSDRLGLEVRDLTDQESGNLRLATGGVVVVSVRRNGPARPAGIRPGDILLKINGKSIGSVAEFNRVQAELPSKRASWMSLRRGNQSIILTIRPA